MKKNLATASVVPDKRRGKNDGCLPLKLRITFKGERKYYGTGMDATEEEWQAIQQKVAKGELKKKSLAVAEIEVNAQKCCDGIPNFSFVQFEKEFFPKKLEVTDLKTAFASYTYRGMCRYTHPCASVAIGKFPDGWVCPYIPY